MERRFVSCRKILIRVKFQKEASRERDATLVFVYVFAFRKARKNVNYDVLKADFGELYPNGNLIDGTVHRVGALGGEIIAH